MALSSFTARRAGWLLASLGPVLGVVLVGVDPGGAAFPGRDGRVVYSSSYGCDDRSPSPGGCGGQALTSVSPTRPHRPRTLTCRAAACRALGPDVSPSGREIAYDGDERSREILVSNIDGSGAKVAARGSGVAWSPKGRRLVFTGSGGRTLFVRSVAGGKPRRVTRGLFPDWSARGQIAFVRFDKRERPDVYLTDPYGRKVRRLTWGGGSDSPNWSPDGRRLAIERHSNIAIIDRAGRVLTQVTRKGGETPAWSPDGEEIAFYRREGSPSSGSIYLVGARGGGVLRRIARYLGSGGGIDWAPRGPSD